MEELAARTEIETAELPTETIVHIVGEKSLNTELLVDFMEDEFEFTCRLSAKDALTAALNEPQVQTHLALIDYEGMHESKHSKLPEIGTALEDPRCRLILYNVDPAHRVEMDALKRGVRGILYKHQPIELFPRAVRAVLNGELWFSRKILTQYIAGKDNHSNPTDEARVILLTLRERQIVITLAKGWSNQKIARHFRISINTVKTHVYNIYKKIKVANRLQASLWLANGVP
jgi:DNA-binding NarL/FixJ family response regulator